MARFFVDYTYHARSSTIIEAESLDAAKAKIEAEIEADDFDLDADEIDDVDFSVNEMHPVTRGGKEIWATRVRADDVRGHASALKTAPLFAEAS